MTTVDRIYADGDTRFHQKLRHEYAIQNAVAIAARTNDWEPVWQAQSKLDALLDKWAADAQAERDARIDAAWGLT